MNRRDRNVYLVHSIGKEIIFKMVKLNRLQMLRLTIIKQGIVYKTRFIPQKFRRKFLNAKTKKLVFWHLLAILNIFKNDFSFSQNYFVE